MQRLTADRSIRRRNPLILLAHLGSGGGLTRQEGGRTWGLVAGKGRPYECGIEPPDIRPNDLLLSTRGHPD
jgi:hypothetical protein